LKPIAVFLLLVFLLCACAPSGEKPILATNPTLLPEITPLMETAEVGIEEATLYFQDFENNSTEGIFHSNTNWQIQENEGGRKSLCNSKIPYFSSFFFGQTWGRNYAVEVVVKAVELLGEAYISINPRFDVDTGYSYAGTFGFKNGYYDFNTQEPYQSFSQGTVSDPLDKWFTFRLEVFGDRINYYIDNKQVGAAEEKRFLRGPIKFSASTGLQVCIDSLRVTSLDDSGRRTAAPTPITPVLEVVAENANAWGPHIPKIVRTMVGVFAVYETAGVDEFHNQWHLAWRQSDGTWPVIAQGEAGGEEPNLLASPDGTLHIIAWPERNATMWSGKPEKSQIDLVVEDVPVLEEHGSAYNASGIDSAGNICVVASSGGPPSRFNWSCLRRDENQWRGGNLILDYRYCYSYVFPQPDGSLELVSTRDVLWKELGYKWPPGRFEFVYNKFTFWSMDDFRTGEFKEVYSQEVLPTEQYPYVSLNAEYESYLDTSGNMHIFYTEDGERTAGWGQYLQVVVSPLGELLAASRLPDEFENFNRLIEDTKGNFFVLSSAGYLLPAGADGITYATPITIDLQSYKVVNPGIAVASPRGGTPISDTVDAIFPDGEGRWVYFQFPLPGN
jgi:hypothetical protein